MPPDRDSSRPLRIVLLEPAGRGGIHQYSRALARALADSGVDVLFVTARDHEFATVDRAAPPPFRCAPLFARRQTPPRALLAALRDFAPDVIHLQSGTHPLLHWLLLLAARRATGAPVVVTAHDLVPKNGGKFAALAALALHRAADRVIVHGNGLRDELARTLRDGASRVRVLPHGEASELVAVARALDRADGAEPDAAEIPESPTSDRAPTLLFFGYLHEEKGLPDLIAALPEIASRVPDARLVIAGTPEMAIEPLKEQARALGVAARIEWRLGYVAAAALPELFSAVTAVVLPYRKASQSGVVFLAGAFALPLIATRVGALEEVVRDGETGLLVPPGNPQEFAKACSELLSDRARARNMGKKLSIRCRDEWSWTAIGAKTRAIYRELAAEVSGDENVVDRRGHARHAASRT